MAARHAPEPSLVHCFISRRADVGWGLSGMGTDASIDRLKSELDRQLDNMSANLDRIEILVAALNSFNRPVPDYEPGFHHLMHFTLGVRELGRSPSDKNKN
jgi:hypothetical protein